MPMLLCTALHGGDEGGDWSPCDSALPFMVEMGVVTGAHVALPMWSFMVEMGVVASPAS